MLQGLVFNFGWFMSEARVPLSEERRILEISKLLYSEAFKQLVSKTDLLGSTAVSYLI